ncbi:MAG TPA: tetratricopeptide repeat protein, partial [Burkholderiaceae bacterium]|nr:tetratricopeptide repeat protein [Burkholderiaceae bacterium]
VLRAIQPGDNVERQQLASAEALVLREARRYQDAFDRLAKELTTQPESAELLYDYALAAEKLDKVDVMEKALRRVITLRPDDPHAYNALGYSLADRRLRLDEARQLVEKAVQLAPDDPFIADSLGWVEYRSGNFKRAIEILERAYAIRPDAEIAAHLGEVLWAAGERARAEALWRSAKERDPSNETLVETLARHQQR